MTFKKGCIGSRKGVKFSEETKRKIGLAHKGHKHTEKTKEKMRNTKLNKFNPMWKGDKASLNSLHSWVKYRKPKPKFCELCHKKEPFDLANISDLYKRDVNDFRWLCRSCHMKEDGRLNKLHQKIREYLKNNPHPMKGVHRFGEDNPNYKHGKTHNNKCIDCGKRISLVSIRCHKCAGRKLDVIHLTSVNKDGRNNPNWKGGRSINYKRKIKKLWEKYDKNNPYTLCIGCISQGIIAEIKKYEESVEVDFKGSNEFICLNCWENSKEYANQKKEMKENGIYT